MARTANRKIKPSTPDAAVSGPPVLIMSEICSIYKMNDTAMMHGDVGKCAGECGR